MQHLSKGESVPRKRSKLHELGDRLALAAAMMILLVWLAYGWERITGLTFSTRQYHPGQIANAAHLESTRRTAVGLTAVLVPLVLFYAAFVRRAD